VIEVRSGGAGVVAVRGHGRDAANFGAVRHRRGSLIGEVADQLLEGRLFDFTLQCEIAQRFPSWLLLLPLVVIRVAPRRVHVLLRNVSVVVGRHGLVRTLP